jgi:hypothetical protein
MSGIYEPYEHADEVGRTDGGCNPQSASTSSRGTISATDTTGIIPAAALLTTSRLYDIVTANMDETVRSLIQKDQYRIGLVIDNTVECKDIALHGLRNPISTCRVEMLTVLNPDNALPCVAVTNSDDGEEEEEEEEETEDGAEVANKREEGTFEVRSPPENDEQYRNSAREWLQAHSLDVAARGDNDDDCKDGGPEIRFGPAGFQSILDNAGIDIVYIFIPHDHHQYVMRALRACKHVLIKDLVSTPCDEFREQIGCARAVGRFLQFSTMFVNHYRSQSFMNCVSAQNTFGAIQHIKAMLSIHHRDLGAIDVTFPLLPGQGCIRRLVRYNLLISTLILRVGSKPVTAQVLESVADEASGQPISADCIVKFADNVVLECHVDYSMNSATRQVLTVKASNKYATMTDFVIPHPDGLATYRVYDKERNDKTGQLEVTQGECLDVPTGPSINVAMWRKFHELCKTIDDHGWTDGPETEEALRLTESSLQTKCILIALDESFKNNGAEVKICGSTDVRCEP